MRHIIYAILITTVITTLTWAGSAYRPSGTVSQSPVAAQNTAFTNLTGYYRRNPITTYAVRIPQGSTPQTMSLYGSSAYNTNKITIKPFANLSANKNIEIGNHGLYVNGTKVMSW